MSTQAATTNGSHGSGPNAPKRTTLLLNSSELSKWPLLKPLTEFMDMVFIHGHIAGTDRELMPASVLRFDGGPQQLVDELGPDGFCFILSEDTVDDTGNTTSVFLAAGGAKPYKLPKPGDSPAPGATGLFKRDASEAPKANPLPENANEVKWELIAFATDPKRQRQGLAGQLTDMTVAEIRQRNSAAWTAAGKAGKPITVLLLSSLGELNETYYLKRGWSTTARKWMPVGTAGSETGFTVVEMVKVLGEQGS